MVYIVKCLTQVQEGNSNCFALVPSVTPLLSTDKKHILTASAFPEAILGIMEYVILINVT